MGLDNTENNGIRIIDIWKHIDVGGQRQFGQTACDKVMIVGEPTAVYTGKPICSINHIYIFHTQYYHKPSPYYNKNRFYDKTTICWGCHQANHNLLYVWWKPPEIQKPEKCAAATERKCGFKDERFLLVVSITILIYLSTYQTACTQSTRLHCPYTCSLFRFGQNRRSIAAL